jgi:WD40 repeat protein
MFHCRLTLTAYLFLALAFVAEAQQNQPPAKDLHGDPLPDGAVARLGTLRWRHGNLVAFAAFLPGGNSVVSASDDGYIRVWEYPTGKEIRRIKATGMNATEPGSSRPSGYLTAAAMTPDGKTIATSFSSLMRAAPKAKDAPKTEDVIRLHDLATGKELQSLKAHSTLMMALAFSADGKHLTGRDATGIIRVWDWSSAQELANLASRGPNAPQHGYDDYSVDDFLVSSPNGKTLMFAGLSNVLQFADAATAKPTQPIAGHNAAIKSVRFTTDGKHLLTQDGDGMIYKWDAAGSTGPQAIKQPSTSIAPTLLSPDGRVGVELPGSSNIIDDFGPFGPAGIIVGPNGAVPNPKGAKEVSVKLFDPATGKELHKITLQPPLVSLLFSPDSKMLAISSGTEQKIELYDVASAKMLRRLEGLPDPPVGGKGGKGGGGFAAGGVLIGGPAGFGGGRINQHTMVFSEDGKTLAFCWNQAPTVFTLFDTAIGKPSGTLTIPDRNPSSNPVFSADGRCLASHLNDGTVGLVELATGQLRQVYGNKPKELDKDAKVGVLFGGFGGPFGGDSDRGSSWRNRTSTLQTGLRFALSNDGRSLVQVGDDKVAYLWDVMTGRQLAEFPGHIGGLNCVAFAPDGKTVATGSNDTTTLLWEVSKVQRPAAVKALSSAELEACWRVLAETDATKAFSALADLTAVPKDAVPFINERLKPGSPLNPKRVEELLSQLDDIQFKVRDQATRELLKMGEGIVPALDKALATNPSQETTQRLEGLRGKLTGIILQGDRLRAYRAIEVLERIGTPEARQVLQMLADGTPGALITTSAQASLKR